MVHSRVNKWSTFCFKFLEADVDQLLTLHFCFNFVFKVFCLKNLILLAERRICFFNPKNKEGKCGPLIEPTKCKMWTTY